MQSAGIGTLETIRCRCVRDQVTSGAAMAHSLGKSRISLGMRAPSGMENKASGKNGFAVDM